MVGLSSQSYATPVAQNSDQRRAKCPLIFSESMSLEIRVVPLEPFAWVAGKRTGERENKLAERIRREVPSHTLEQFLENRANRLVALQVQFFLWGGGSNV